jgi:hypothetical protein
LLGLKGLFMGFYGFFFVMGIFNGFYPYMGSANVMG